MRHFWQAVVTTLAGALAATAAHAQEIAASVPPADLPIAVGRGYISDAEAPPPPAEPISIHQPVSLEDAQYTINLALFGQSSTAVIPMTDLNLIQPDGPSATSAFDFSSALSTSPRFTGLDESDDELAARIKQQYRANLEARLRNPSFNEQVQNQVGDVGRLTALIFGGWLMNEKYRDRWADLGEREAWRQARRAALGGADRPEPTLQEYGRALVLPPQ